MKLKLGKVATSILVVSLGLGSINLVGAQAASDVSGHWAEKQIVEWVTNGNLQGYSDGTLKPDNAITRAEFVAMVNRMFELTESSPITFKDLSSTNWAYKEMAKAVKAGYIQGYNHNINPKNSVTRQEAAIMIAKIVGLSIEEDNEALSKFKDGDKIASWSKKSVASIVHNNIMKGYSDGRFAPEQALTRAEAVVLIDAAMAAKVALDTPEKEVEDSGDNSPKDPIIAPTPTVPAPAVPTAPSGGGELGGGGNSSGGGSSENIPVPTPTPELGGAPFIDLVYISDLNDNDVLDSGEIINVYFFEGLELMEESRELIIKELEGQTSLFGSGFTLTWDKYMLKIKLGENFTIASGSKFTIPKNVVFGVDQVTLNKVTPKFDLEIKVPIRFNWRVDMESFRQLQDVSSLRVQFGGELSEAFTSLTVADDLVSELVKYNEGRYDNPTTIKVTSIQWDDNKRGLTLNFDKQSFVTTDTVQISFKTSVLKEYYGDRALGTVHDLLNTTDSRELVGIKEKVSDAHTASKQDLTLEKDLLLAEQALSAAQTAVNQWAFAKEYVEELKVTLLDISVEVEKARDTYDFML